MKKIKTVILFLGLVLVSCNSEKKLSEKDINEKVESTLDSNQVYDIAQSLTFSNDNEQYSVVEYSQNDSVKLFVETVTSQNKEFTRQLYLADGKVIFLKEIGIEFFSEKNEEYEVKTYFLGEESQKSYKKILDENGFGKFEELPDTKIIANTTKPKDAVDQQGDFEMKFGEFLIIEPQSYLILENKVSNYNVALFIIDGDYLLDELYTNPDKYKGKTIFANHENALMGGIERMIYRGGILIEN